MNEADRNKIGKVKMTALRERLIDDFEEEDTVHDDVVEFIQWYAPYIWKPACPDRITGRMVLGVLCLMPVRDLEELWAQFQLEKEGV